MSQQKWKGLTARLVIIADGACGIIPSIDFDATPAEPRVSVTFFLVKYFCSIRCKK